MKIVLLVLFCGALSFIKAMANPSAQAFDKTEYYQVLKNGSLADINREMSLIESSSLQGKEAFAGALQMKKAGLLKVPKEKLDNFKKGATKLETVLRADISNAEYRFLRLLIQEHAPKIVKYRKNIEEDASFIKENYKSLTPDVQKIVADYSHTSDALKSTVFAP